MIWAEVLRDPAGGDHIVQAYQDPAFLVDAVAEYLGAGLERGEAAIIIARPEHTARFLEKLGRAAESGPLVILDAEKTLPHFMVDGMPEWTAFRQLFGGLIANVRLQYPAVRAYGEMVDILWQQGKRDAAIRLEEYWNELSRLQTFSLFCAYAIDPLEAKSYAGLDGVCKAHTHFIPTRDARQLDEAVADASRKVLDGLLARTLFSLAEQHRRSTKMPAGQAALFWLFQNLPRAAAQVLQEVKEATRAS